MIKVTCDIQGCHEWASCGPGGELPAGWRMLGGQAMCGAHADAWSAIQAGAADAANTAASKARADYLAAHKLRVRQES